MDAEKRIPRRVAGLLEYLAQVRPTIVTRSTMSDYLRHLDSPRSADKAIRDLYSLGWLATTHIKGAWAFVPAGESRFSDPYVDLQAWRACDPQIVFALAGEAAAWHLGYLPRAFLGRVRVWVPKDGTRPPDGLRPYLSTVALGWDTSNAERVGPSSSLLRRRHLDLTKWAGGLPAFGPEALLAQLATRPSSFHPWTDLKPKLESLANDVDTQRLMGLLTGQSSSAWQRAAYLLFRGNLEDEAFQVLENRPKPEMPKVQFGRGPVGEWAASFRVMDYLIAPTADTRGS